MNYNRKIMRLELSAEKALNGGYYYAELLLPAADYEIKDAMQRARAVGRENTVEVSILECDILPELQDIRLDTFSLDELNFFAKRLASLPDEEMPVFYAVTEQIFNDADENPVSIKDLINCTYAVTDKNGVAKFKDVLIGSGYTLEEVDTPTRYVVPEKQTAAIEWNKVTNKSFDNILKKFNVTVTKSDSEKGLPQGDASLAGAKYVLCRKQQPRHREPRNL